jgi:hypothetical protein
MDFSETKELLKKVEPVISKTRKEQEEKENSGECFNTFKILGVQKNEVRLHSAFLSEILNPSAVHGLCDYFLKPFVRDIAKIEIELDTKNAEVSVEQSIGAISEDGKNGGRFDIAIKFNNPDYLILIENKIDAGDQISQLQRYNNYAKKNYKENYKILYLTVDGHNPSRLSLGNSNVPYSCISYKKDIKNWLKKCIEKIETRPFVDISVRQYIDVIEELTNTELEDNMEKEIIKMLYSKENIELVKTADNFAKIWEEKDLTISRIIAEKLRRDGFSDNGGQLCKKLDNKLELYFEYENCSPNFGFKTQNRFENKKQLKQILESAGCSEFSESNLEDSGNWLSFYFSYGNDKTIDDLYQALKNVLEQLENGYKKIAQ